MPKKKRYFFSVTQIENLPNGKEKKNIWRIGNCTRKFESKSNDTKAIGENKHTQYSRQTHIEQKILSESSAMLEHRYTRALRRIFVLLYLATNQLLGRLIVYWTQRAVEWSQRVARRWNRCVLGIRHTNGYCVAAPLHGKLAVLTFHQYWISRLHSSMWLKRF